MINIPEVRYDQPRRVTAPASQYNSVHRPLTLNNFQLGGDGVGSNDWVGRRRHLSEEHGHVRPTILRNSRNISVLTVVTIGLL